MKRIRSVWEDLANSPEEALCLAERAELMITLGRFFEGADSKKVELRYGVDPATVDDLLAGRIDRLPLDVLSSLLAKVVRIEGPLTSLDSSGPPGAC